jgi:DNA polymerase-3 subunit delta
VPPKRTAGGALDHLESEGPRPLYAIDGEERLLVDEAVAAIKARALPSRAADFNFDQFVCPETPLSRILEAAKTLPAFAERRLVIAKNADKIPAADADLLIAYAGDPSPTTVLVLVAAEKFDGRQKLYKVLEKSGTALRFPHPSEREMPELVRARAKKAGLALDPAGVRALVDAVGPDVALAVAAIEKLVLYAGTKAAAGAAEVEALISPVKEDSIFAFNDALGRGELAEALKSLDNMMRIGGAHPLAILAMIARHFRKLLLARAMLDAGASNGELLPVLGVPPFALDRMLAQARRHGVQELGAGLRAIAAADQALKGGKLPGERVMERLVLQLAREVKPRARPASGPASHRGDRPRL